MDLTSFFVIAALVGAYGGIIYWYSKKLGNGVPAAAWSDPNDRKRLWIACAGLAVFFLIVIIGLSIANIIKL